MLLFLLFNILSVNIFNSNLPAKCVFISINKDVFKLSVVINAIYHDAPTAYSL